MSGPHNIWIIRSVVMVVLGLVTGLSSVNNAERLPIKTYTTADGLPHNSINRIVRDTRGFLWFCTGEGLSRFDGYSFINGVTEGLPHPKVNDLLQTRSGDYWIATNGGLCRFNPKGAPTSRPVYAVDSSSEALREAMFTTYTPADNDDNRRRIRRSGCNNHRQGSRSASGHRDSPRA